MPQKVIQGLGLESLGMVNRKYDLNKKKKSSDEKIEKSKKSSSL